MPPRRRRRTQDKPRTFTIGGNQEDKVLRRVQGLLGAKNILDFKRQSQALQRQGIQQAAQDEFIRRRTLPTPEERVATQKARFRITPSESTVTRNGNRFVGRGSLTPAQAEVAGEATSRGITQRFGRAQAAESEAKAAETQASTRFITRSTPQRGRSVSTQPQTPRPAQPVIQSPVGAKPQAFQNLNVPQGGSRPAQPVTPTKPKQVKKKPKEKRTESARTPFSRLSNLF